MKAFVDTQAWFYLLSPIVLLLKNVKNITNFTTYSLQTNMKINVISECQQYNK